MKYDSFLVTHNQLRSQKTFSFFANRFKNGEGFLSRANKISFIRTEDDKLYLCDGHHEVAAAFHAGLDLTSASIQVKRYTYAQMNEVNFSCGYVTPYNPATHVRKNDFKWFKEAILSINTGWKNYDEPPTKEFLKLCTEWAYEAIDKYKSAYLEERKVFSIEEIVPCGQIT